MHWTVGVQQENQSSLGVSGDKRHQCHFSRRLGATVHTSQVISQWLPSTWKYTWHRRKPKSVALTNFYGVNTTMVGFKLWWLLHGKSYTIAICPAEMNLTYLPATNCPAIHKFTDLRFLWQNSTADSGSGNFSVYSEIHRFRLWTLSLGFIFFVVVVFFNV